MCELQLCLQLLESLGAAFRGGVYEGAEYIGAWGQAVVSTLQEYSYRYPYAHLWEIANGNLQSMIMHCPCEGLAESILCKPEAFVRTTLMIAKHYASCQEQRQGAVLH